MAVTLADFAKIEEDPLRKSVLNDMIMEASLLEFVPWESINQLNTTLVKLKTLPSVGYRQINGAFSESTGTFEQKSESVALGGLDIDVDIAVARAGNSIADVRSTQQMMALMQWAYTFNQKFIYGNSGGSTPEEFKGINIRIDSAVVEGYVDQKLQANDTDTGVLNSSAASQAFLDDLDKLITAIPGHQPDLLLMNLDMLRAVRSILRREKLLNNSADMFGRPVTTWGEGGPRLLDIGTTSDQITKIITSTETVAGVADGSGECTSIFAVKFGVEQYCWGIQEYPLEVRDLGELQTGPQLRTRIDWPHGIATLSPKSCARLYGVVPDASA